MGDAAPFVSAISALIAVVFAIVIYFLTRRKERPVISLTESKVESSLETVHLFLEFKNVGKNPALKVKIHMYGCPRGDTLMIKKMGSIHIVNQKDPGISFSWRVEVKPVYYSIELDNDESAGFLFYIELTYQDIFTKKDYRNELWFIHKKGEHELKDMDIKDYRNMEKEIREMKSVGFSGNPRTK